MNTTPLHKSGDFYSGFLQKHRLPEGDPVYGPDERAVVESAVSHLISQATSSKNPGVLLGMIQSGKTKTFLGIVALAFDNGFDVAIILTKPTTALVKQTFRRVKKEFGDFIDADQAKVFDILDIPTRLSGFELGQKLIFILKKQVNNLDRLNDALLSDYPELKDKRILIVDDEADTTTIGYTHGETGDLELRTIADQIDALRRALPRASFLQVTATPYSLYLQPEGSPIPSMNLAPVRPTFTDLVPVHKDYVGGDYYFNKSKDPASPTAFIYDNTRVTKDELLVLRQPDARRFKIEDCLTSEKISGLRTAIVTFLTGGVIRRMQDERPPKRRPKRFAFLFHTEATKAAHAWQETVVLALYDHLKLEAAKKSEILRSLTRAAYDDLARSIMATDDHALPDFADVFERVVSALIQDQVTVTKVNSEAQVNTLLDEDGQLELRTPLNIFIGGQIIDRGITIANLIGFYYGRDPQRFQQDTVMQHSRIYGFRSPEDIAVTRLFTAPHIYSVMRRMHEADMALRERLEEAGDDRVVTFIELDDRGLIVPCNPTKILASNITTLRPQTRLLPYGFLTDYKTRLQAVTQRIDAKVSALLGRLPASGESPPPKEAPLQDVLEIVDLINQGFAGFEPGYEETWDPAEFKAILSHFSNESTNPSTKGLVFLLARTGRHVKRIQASGKFADSPETGQDEGAMAKQASAVLPVLMLIRQEGREVDHWRDCPFWWPVLITPLAARTTLFARSK